MITNNDIIPKKVAALKAFSARPMQEVAADLARLFGDVRDVKIIERPWFPGGGAALVYASLNGEDVFIKIKDKTLKIETRLECESAFPESTTLNNEALFCRLLADDPNVPRLKAYKEDDKYAYVVFERLTPFDQVIKQLDIYEIYLAYREIESLLRRLYSKGIVHTDVHEKNILFRGKQPVLCDFEEARLLIQDNTPFERSLDVTGENSYGKVGAFPTGRGVEGLTCLYRLRKVLKPLLKKQLPEFLKKCSFNNDCPFNLDELQGKDERIYQSVDLGDNKYVGQRPLHDHRHDILARLLDVLDERLGKHMHVVDIGSNLGTLAFTAAHSDAVAKVTGLEALPEYVQGSQILSLLYNQEKVHFILNQAGVDPLPREPIDVLLLFSVYHHIRDKDAFLQELSRNRPRTIIGEMAVQERYYKQRGDLDRELQHIQKTLSYKMLQIIGITSDYKRPICLFSEDPPYDQLTLDRIMGVKAPAKSWVSFPYRT